ncbi:MAG: THUMP domain-containing protein [Candidatus Heimdallarchaeota archaeon]|nr:THUMP domain-containing protein [Candidatus Heimdallarchaeota archaeon]
MEDYPGFVISSARTLEKNASSEMYYVLSELLNQEDVHVVPVTGISGLSIVSFQGDPIQILKEIQTMVEEQPIFQYVLKIVPIRYKIHTSLENMSESAIKLNSEIGEEDTWRINVRRRHTQIPRNEIIAAIANEISNGKVMLESPHHYIVVEIIGKWTYLSVSSIPELPISSSQFIDNEDEFTF